MLQVELQQVERALCLRFGTEVHITSDVDPNLLYSVTSDAFAERRGARLLITRPFGSRIVAKVGFDVFATHLIDVWKTMDDNVVAAALNYLCCYRTSLSVDLRVNGTRLTNDEGSIRGIKSITSPADVSLRVSKEIVGDTEAEDLIEVISCAYGFVFILSGVLADAGEPGEAAPHIEGGAYQATTTHYERSPINRAICIAAHGATCAVCGMDFGVVYGPLASGFIEVHHRHPVSTMSGGALVDPVKDLVPLCPNCHAVVHMEDPPIDPERLRRFINERAEI